MKTVFLLVAVINLALLLSKIDGTSTTYWMESVLSMIFVAVGWVFWIEESNIE
jgi:hypothetical protein